MEGPLSVSNHVQVSLESSFYCDSELNGISSSNESSRRLNRRTYMQEYRRKRNIDVIGDENVTELSYRNGRKRKLRTYYFRESMEEYRKNKTSDVEVKDSESAREKKSRKKLKSCNTENNKVMKLIQSFHSSIEVGPEYACTCCD